MIRITSRIAIPEDELKFSFIRSSGPGGQHVNKTSSAVQLRFNVLETASLPAEVKDRLCRKEKNRITADGSLVIEARRYRSQDRNRQDAVDRLVRMVERAAAPPKPRKATRPSRAAKERRLDEKRKRAEKKRGRGPVDY